MIELQKKELVFDIKNTAAAYADSISSSVEDSHLIHNIYDVGEDGNRDKLARILDSAVEDCKEMLFRYTKMEMLGGGFDSNEWEECIGSPTNDEDAYYLAMRMPSGFSKTSVHTMTVYIHDYIVNQSLYEWLMMFILMVLIDSGHWLRIRKRRLRMPATARLVEQESLCIHFRLVV